jgi:hypothetical protein
MSHPCLYAPVSLCSVPHEADLVVLAPPISAAQEEARTGKTRPSTRTNPRSQSRLRARADAGAPLLFCPLFCPLFASIHAPGAEIRSGTGERPCDLPVAYMTTWTSQHQLHLSGDTGEQEGKTAGAAADSCAVPATGTLAPPRPPRPLDAKAACWV